MADITMCMGEECPLKEHCFRYLAEPEPDDMQTYFMRPPIKEEECDFYWEMPAKS